MTEVDNHLIYLFKSLMQFSCSLSTIDFSSWRFGENPLWSGYIFLAYNPREGTPILGYGREFHSFDPCFGDFLSNWIPILCLITI